MKRALALLLLAACHGDWDAVLDQCVADGRCTVANGGGGTAGSGGGAGGGSANGGGVAGGVVLQLTVADGGAFRVIEPGTADSLDVVLRNVGGARSGVTLLSVAGGPFAVVSQCQSGNPLGPGDRCNPSAASVAFSPTALGTFQAQLVATEDGSGADASVTLTGTAAWGPIALRVLTNGGTGQGGVLVMTDDGGATFCDGGCVGLTYPRHAQLTLTAGGSRSDFARWSSGPCAPNAGPCSFELADDAGETVVAQFDAWPQLSVDVFPSTVAPTDVHVALEDGGFDCPAANCSIGMQAGSTFTLSASGSGFATFVDWTACPNKQGTKCSGTMVSAGVHVSANFSALNRAFVYPTALPLNLGASTYDSLCSSAATTAKLGNGHWLALMSMDGGAPQDRFAGVNAWVRTDGKPFTQSLLQPTNELYYPLTLAPDGTDLSAGQPLIVVTGMDGGTCGGWTQTGGNATAGNATAATAKRWVNGAAVPCSDAGYIYCLQADYNTTLPPLSFPDGGRLAFVSNTINAFAAGDFECNKEAADAGEFVALRSDQMKTAVERLNLDGGSWYRLDGVEVGAPGGPGTGLLAPLNQTHAGVHLNAAVVWTGAQAATLLGDAVTSCGDWALDAGVAIVGDGTDSSLAWFKAGQLSCDGGARVYCFQK